MGTKLDRGRGGRAARGATSRDDRGAAAAAARTAESRGASRVAPRSSSRGRLFRASASSSGASPSRSLVVTRQMGHWTLGLRRPGRASDLTSNQRDAAYWRRHAACILWPHSSAVASPSSSRQTGHAVCGSLPAGALRFFGLPFFGAGGRAAGRGPTKSQARPCSMARTARAKVRAQPRGQGCAPGPGAAPGGGGAGDAAGGGVPGSSDESESDDAAPRGRAPGVDDGDA